MRLKVKCPKCGNTMICEPRGNSVINKKKRCVYCGNTFPLFTRKEGAVHIVKMVR